MRILTQINDWLFQQMRRPYYFLLLGLATFLDIFVFFLPTDAMVLAAVFAKPRRWGILVLSAAVGSVLGSLLLAGAVEHYGLSLIENFAPEVLHSVAWTRSVLWMEKYGKFAIFFIALSPLTLPPVVALAALAFIPYSQIGGLLLLGRLLKYSFLAWVTIQSPRFFSKRKTPP